VGCGLFRLVGWDSSIGQWDGDDEGDGDVMTRE